jgi:hypothetical protein
LVKIPNKLRELLREPETFSLTAESETIGVIEQTKSDFNPEDSELTALQGKRRKFTANCKLDIPIKRQKVTETQSLFF